MSKNQSWIWSGALIGRRGSYIVLAIVYKQQTKDKGPNENVMNLLQKGQYSWNIAEVAFKFCWSSFAEEHKTLPESTRRIQKSNKFSFGTPWLSDLLCKHWFTSSVWNFYRWGADVLLGETFPRREARRDCCFRRLGNSGQRPCFLKSLKNLYYNPRDAD